MDRADQRPGDRRPHDQHGLAGRASTPMTDSPPAPGPDQIVVTAPAVRAVCHSREHARLGVLAEVVVTFGEQGARWQRDALWQDSWGQPVIRDVPGMLGHLPGRSKCPAQAGPHRHPPAPALEPRTARWRPQRPWPQAGAFREAGRAHGAAG